MDNNTLRVSLAVIALIAATIVWSALPMRRSVIPFPPGPPQWFWSGNYHQIPKRQPWLTYTAWGNVYGPIVYFRIFSETNILLNSGKAVLDLLESRSSIYSDRPFSWMFGELLGRKLNVFRITIKHPRFKTYRKMMHSGLSPRAVQNYRPLQESETRQLLKGLLDTPENFVAHLRRSAGALILKVAYGYDVSQDSDIFVKAAEEAFLTLHNQKLARLFMVDYFPILRFVPEWFPFAEFKRTANEFKKTKAETMPFHWAKSVIASGNHVESFTSRFLCSDGGRMPGEEEQDIIAMCTAGLYVGGSDTIPSAMTSFFALMTLYPEAQKLAQEEIDSVVGNNRLPTLDDQSSLPYISALLKENLRWAPPAPLGFKHRVMEDDIYKGFQIPKGSSIIPNIWAITHDPDLYPDPFTFEPRRHLGHNAQIDPLKFIFGFGRRVCPGANFAEVSLFLTMSNVLAAFHIGKEVVDGKEIVPNIEWVGGAPVMFVVLFSQVGMSRYDSHLSQES